MHVAISLIDAYQWVLVIVVILRWTPLSGSCARIVGMVACPLDACRRAALLRLAGADVAPFVVLGVLAILRDTLGRWAVGQ
ncbi:MAG: hypothetical protein AB7O52_10415 [Planctomycetota bacterium]